MAVSIEDRRNFTSKPEPEERKSILFHIAHIEGLPTRPGWTPRERAYVSVENLETKETFETDHKRASPGQTSWIENLPLLQVTDSSSVQFAIKHQGLLNKRSVSGTTDAFSIHDLLKMQRVADLGVDKLVKLPVALEPSTTRGRDSPKSARLSRSSLSTPRSITSRSPRGSLDVLSLNRSVSPIRSPIRSPFSPSAAAPHSPRYATLFLAVRETAVDPGMNIRVNAASWKNFVELCRNDSLDELRFIVDKVVSLRNAFGQDSNAICLVDIILGAIEATRKLLSDPDTMNVNRHITHVMKAVNVALAPYQTFSQRQLGKSGESSVLFLQEMLFSIVSTMWVVGAVFDAKGDAFARDKLESRVIAWTDYFQSCSQFLNGEVDQKPSLPAHKASSTRAHCPNVLRPNPKIPQHNMISMTLPAVHHNAIYDQAEVVNKLSEWVFATTFSQVPSPTQELVTFTLTLPSVPNSPTSPRTTHRPPPLDLQGHDNFLQPQAIHSILRASETREKPKRSMSLGLPINSVFCLSGRTRTSTTQLAARMCEWLVQLKCLGGYFTFERGSDMRISFDSLVTTLIHQATTTERDSVGAFRKALTVNDGALHLPLEKRFETLFVEPFRDFVAGQTQTKWSPSDPLVFIIDGVDMGDEDATMTKIMVDFICSSVFGKLPRYVKFFMFMKSETEVERMLKERGVNVFEMGPTVESSSIEDVANGGLSVDSGMWPIDSTAVKPSSVLVANQL